MKPHSLCLSNMLEIVNKIQWELHHYFLEQTIKFLKTGRDYCE